MKKLLSPLFPAAVALGLFAAGAQAQSISMYGLIDLSVGRTQAPGGVATKAVDSGKMTTSNFGMRGTEDLGGGFKAQFVLESFMRNDTGQAGRFDADTFWARNAYVGLDGRLGSLQLGRVTTSLFVQTLLFNPFGDSFGFSPSIRHWFTSNTTTGDTGWSDSVRWLSPRVGGFSASAHAALGEANGGRNIGASANYGAGPLSAGFAWQKVEKGATVADTTSWQLAGAYDLKTVKLFGQYGDVSNDTTNRDFRILGIGLTAPVGPLGTLRAQWGQIDPEVGGKRNTLTLGYGYNLSRRSELYGALMSDRVAGTGAGTGTGRSYSVGMRHRF